MVVESTKKIRTREFKLSQLKGLKIVDLNSEDGEDDFCFLEDGLKEHLSFLLTEKNKYITIKKPFSYKEVEDVGLKFSYDLSYCQSSHFYFNEGSILLKDVLRLLNIDEKDFKRILRDEDVYFNIGEHNNIEFNNYMGFENEEDITEELETIEEESLKELEEDLTEFLNNLSKILKDYGYKTIENQQEENVLRSGFRDFLIENDINENIELWDVDYKTENKKGYVKVCSDGDTNLKGLWIKDFNLKRVYELQTFKPQVEQTTTIIL